MRQAGDVAAAEWDGLIARFGKAFSERTMQGFAYRKPHGYAGDFEIIDHIYTRYHADDPRLHRWNAYWQSHAAAQAVRNRMAYFAATVAQRIQGPGHNRRLRLLNVASGPGRDMLHFFEQHPALADRVAFVCLEQDSAAIDHAQRLCVAHRGAVEFVQANAVRFTTRERFDLVWSAGLFDYFTDRVFVSLLRRLLGLLTPAGDLVIGNFCVTNPSRAYMDLFDWQLRHRSPVALRALAAAAGAGAGVVDVRRQPSGVSQTTIGANPEVQAFMRGNVSFTPGSIAKPARQIRFYLYGLGAGRRPPHKTMRSPIALATSW